MRRATALLTLSRSRYGVGLLPDPELAARLRDLEQQATAAAAKARTAEQDKQRFAREGGGHTERELLKKRDKLIEQVRRIETAAAAADRMRQVDEKVAEAHQQLDELRRRELAITRELDSLRPWHRVRRRELEAQLPEVRGQQARSHQDVQQILKRRPALEEHTRQAAEQAPHAATWPLIRQRHAELTRDFDAVQRGARTRDVTAAARRADEARAAQVRHQRELDVLKNEVSRRADLSPNRREIEQAVRAEHAEERRQTSAEHDSGRATSTRPSQRSRSTNYQPPQRQHENSDRSHDVGR